MAWFIVAVMVLSVFGVITGSFFTKDEQKIEYKGFQFYKYSNQWLFRHQKNEYRFQHNPPELENITLSPNIDLNHPKIYLGFQPNDQINLNQAFSTLAGVFYNQQVKLQQACISEKDCPDIPLINCQENPGIILISGEKNSYVSDEKCLIITATNQQELQKLTERLAYNLLGILT